MTALAHGRVVMTANEAAAHAVMLARARAIGCYPITPQTLIVEKLAELVVGHDEIEFANVESEHGMFGYVIAAARAGVRTFTATSSQGLLYAHEQLHRASRERIPLVAVNVNRSILAPWSLEPDLADGMSQRDTGWIQLYCASGQELLDGLLLAYRVAESTLLPVLVNAEGFLLSHTSEAVDVPEQADVDAFLPELCAPESWVLDPTLPRNYSALPDPADYYRFQLNVVEAHELAKELVESVADEFSARFGRRKAGSLELAGNLEASKALVTVGTIGETAKELLADDDDLLLVRVHVYRPFPAARIAAALGHAQRVVVFDRAPGFGSLGPLGADVRALGIRAANVIGGLGGVEVTPATLRWALEQEPQLAPTFVPEGI